MKKIVSRALVFLAIMAAHAGPAFATDIVVDGYIRGACDVATASAGAATLNNKCGVITTESLSTLAGSEYTLTLTNSTVAATDIIVWAAENGTNAVGEITPVRATPGTGSVTFVIQNSKQGTGAVATSTSGTTWSGTLKIRYMLIRP